LEILKRRDGKMAIEHVPGKNAGKIMLYALSTCGWCQKTKAFLDELGVEYDFEYVDHLQGAEREQEVEAVKKWNQSCSFPTLVVNDETCIVGYQEEKIRAALKL